MATPSCPTCRKPVRPRADNDAFPFCSSRCKQIDLGRWLDEKYRLPAEENPEDDVTPKEEEPR